MLNTPFNIKDKEGFRTRLKPEDSSAADDRS